VRRHRRLLRERRRDLGLPVVALVGYTNAGKTTLLNRLTGAGAPTRDQLFVTLDPAARLVTAAAHQPFILTDTVGFIRKLPPQLVAAFRATLEELGEADLLLHVADASHPRLEEQMSAVHRTLQALDLADKPVVLVLNKVDRLGGQDGGLRQLLDEGGIPVSALTGEGTPELLQRIEVALKASLLHVRVLLPYGRAGVIGALYERGRVLRREDRPDGILLDVELPQRLAGLVAGLEA